MTHRHIDAQVATGLLLVAGLAAMFAPPPTLATLYTFENLVTGTLSNQDNWVTLQPANPARIQVTAPGGTGNGSTKVAADLDAGANQHNRVNNANYAFPTIATGRNAVFQADLRVLLATSSTAGFSLYNSAGGGLPFQLYTQGGTRQFEFDNVSSPQVLASFPARIVDGDWLSVRLEADMPGNRASIYYKDLSLGDSSFTPISGMQNITFLNGGSAPGTWNAMFLNLINQGQLDNLLVESVPEPSVLFLLGSGALLLWRRVRRQP